MVQPTELLQVSSIIAAGVVSKPGSDISDPEAVAKQIVAIAKALIKEAAKNS